MRSSIQIPPWAKKFIPILVSAIILYYYFHSQDWSSVFGAARRINFTIAIPAVILPQLVFWFFEVLIIERHVTWFHGLFSFKTFFWVRGAAYLLMMVSPYLGSGGILAYVWKKSEIKWKKLLGITLFRFGLTMWGLCVVLIPTAPLMYYFGLFEKAKIHVWVWWGILVFGVYWLIEAWLFWHQNTHFGLSKILVKNREAEFWTAFRMASPKQWLFTWFMGVPPFILSLIGIYFVSRAFEMNIPLLEFMAVYPLLMFIIDLPIAFAGFGTTTIAFAVFFGGYASTESIAALTLFLPFARATIRVLIGLASLQPALQDINIILRKPSAKEKKEPSQLD
ncbi:MAG: flippase-like domain-containing protein [Spirochaetota bacterium]|nr:MAG: flippase-like domain-containing protein [Spirochaetota bacterium]